ncbi:MAG: rhamnulose-1-phosphate aldolase [Chloroflexi bacterium]|nr:MAG: rhamnulose-1-phosphate aldolase [Chloroflexota bacterium]
METIDDLLWEIGEAGLRLTELRALEGAAGNISVYLPGGSAAALAGITEVFSASSDWRPPSAERLPAGVLLVTGTGKRLRDAARSPAAVLCAIVIDGSGACTLRHAPEHAVRPTSEIDSHFGIHAALAATGAQTRTIIHAQPPHLTWLSHIPAYRHDGVMNRQLYRWQPETIVMLPEGLAVLPYVTPGTPEQGEQTTAAALQQRVIIWAKHGVIVHVAGGPLAAVDLIDYVEAAARYEVLDIQAGSIADGLSGRERQKIAARFGVVPLQSLIGDE